MSHDFSMLSIANLGFAPLSEPGSVRTSVQTTNEYGHANTHAASMLVKLVSGHRRAEDGRWQEGGSASRREEAGRRKAATRLERESGRWTAGGTGLFRRPEAHRRIGSGNRKDAGTGGLD